MAGRQGRRGVQHALARLPISVWLRTAARSMSPVESGGMPAACSLCHASAASRGLSARAGLVPTRTRGTRGGRVQVRSPSSFSILGPCVPLPAPGGPKMIMILRGLTRSGR